MIKTNNEIIILKKCSKITERALNKTVNNIENRSTINQLYRIFKKNIEHDNANFQHLSLMKKGIGMFDDNDCNFDSNMIIGFDAGAIYKNYISDTGLTIFKGEYLKSDLNLYKKLFCIMEEGLSEIKPGVSCIDIYNKMKSENNKLGLQNTIFEGHGIGLSFREYPLINENVDYTYNNGFEEKSANFIIAKSMVINIEVTYPVFTKKTFHLEKTVFVTDNGIDDISNLKRNLPMIIK
jgi:Xaa-Pro aminopeptidase